jgi:hypothetical protein
MPKLTPPHGWNVVAWDLGIITLGVLIALAAQQIADDLHWRVEARDFRQAVRAEMSGDLGTYIYRSNENHCVEARLDELQRWLDSWRAKRPLTLEGPIGIPESLVIRTNVWDGRDASTVAHMTLDEKLDYGYLYTEFANNEIHRLDERATWIALADYDGASELDHQDLMRLQGLITRARLRNYRLTTNSRRFMKRAAAMGILPRALPDFPPPDPTICHPILARTARGQPA